MPRNQIIIFSCLLAVSIIFLSLGEATNFSLANTLSSILLYPIETIYKYKIFLSTSTRYNKELEVMVNQLRLENARLRYRLNNISPDYSPERFKLLKVQIIGRDPSNINGYLHIDKGEDYNLTTDQPVISIDGLVGKIKYVGARHSIIETIENPGVAVSAVDVRSGVHGIVKKRNRVLFDYIKIDDDVDIGDSIFTSGMSEFFPKGIFIGTVSKINPKSNLFFKDVYLELGVRLSRVTNAYVILSEVKTGYIEPTKKDEQLNKLKPVIPKFER